MDASTSATPVDTAMPVPILPDWLDRAAYPFVPRGFATPDGVLRYVDEGHGDPVLLVHGTPSWSYEWRHAIAALRHHHRVIAPDHLGFGLSDKPPGAAYRPEDHARRLQALVRRLDLRHVTLVVHDFGGPIGLGLLRDEAARIDRIIVVNSWAWPHGDIPRIRRLSSLVRSWLGRFLYLRLNASPRWIVPASFADRSRLRPAIHAHYLGPFTTPGTRTAPWVLGCELAGSDPYYAELWALRETIAARPLHLVWGTADPAFDVGYLERWLAAFPHADVTRLPGVGHFPQEEAPAELLAAIERALTTTAD